MPQNSKQITQPYALPTNGEIKLGTEDSWTNAMDRKEKKRIQNRVAQRSYRHRMKTRLGELQSQLECYESQNQQNRAENNDDDAEATTLPLSLNTQGTGSNQTSAIETMTPRSQSHPAENSVMAQFEILQHLQSQIQNLVPGQSTPRQQPDVDPTLLNTAQPVFTQPVPAFNNPQQTSHMLQLLESSCTNLLAQRDQLAAIMQHTGGVCADAMQSVEYTSASHTPDPKDNGMDFDWGPTEDLYQWKPQTLSGSSEAQPRRQSSVSPRSMPFTGTSTSASAPESSKTLSQKQTEGQLQQRQQQLLQQQLLQQQAPPQVLTPQTVGPDARSRLPNASSSPEPLPRFNSVELSPPPVDASIDERLEWMLECGEAAGFDSFDCLATAYYGSTSLAASSSYLAGEQHLSRSRRLPKLLADLFAAAQSWNTREQRGFHDEVLKTAEAILGAEERSMRERKEPASVLHDVFEAGDGTPDCEMLAGRDAGGMKRLIQSELPNLWALVTALTTGNKSLRQRDRSGAALATIVLLHCVGRVPKQKLLQILDSFL